MGLINVFWAPARTNNYNFWFLLSQLLDNTSEKNNVSGKLLFFTGSWVIIFFSIFHLPQNLEQYLLLNKSKTVLNWELSGHGFDQRYLMYVCTKFQVNWNNFTDAGACQKYQPISFFISVSSSPWYFQHLILTTPLTF